MGIDYSKLLTSDQKIKIINERITQFASEAYQLEINLKLAEANSEQEKFIKDNIATYEKAIEVHQEELALLNSNSN